MRARGWPVAALGALVVLAAACGGDGGGQQPVPAGRQPAACLPTSRVAFELPSLKGINYGEPTTAGGEWLGSRWLRSDTAVQPGWDAARPRLQADLAFISANHLGQIVRIFVSLDQLMVWDRSQGFVSYDEAALQHLSAALDEFDAHNLRAYAVLFDQEEVSSPGNFRFQALDGTHPAMRAGYLRAVDVFLRRFGSRKTVVGWDLFNEAYNSLGTRGGLARPPASDPVSPNYSDRTVRAWILDLYHTARCAAPDAWFTVSDTTDLYWKTPPGTALYEGAVDFYDMHVYDDRPKRRDWRRTLGKPYILGEVGGDIDHGFKDQAVNSRVVRFWLEQARPLGVAAVLAHAADGAVYTLPGGLTQTGRVVAEAP